MSPGGDMEELLDKYLEFELPDPAPGKVCSAIDYCRSLHIWYLFSTSPVLLYQVKLATLTLKI